MRWLSPGRAALVSAALLAAVNVEAKNKPDEEILKAAKKGDSGKIHQWLSQGADVNARDKDQRTPLIHAVRGGKLEAVRTLLDAKADVNLQDEDGNTALMEAAKRDEPQPALDLIAAGSKLNLRDNDGWTALMEAAKHGTLAVSRELIRKKADLDVRTADGRSALSLAAERGTTALVDELIDARVDVRNPEIGGYALLVAAKNDRVDVVLRLMQAKAPLGYSNWEGETLLHAAASRGQERVVGALLQAGVRPDMKDKQGRTPLILAAASGHEDVVESLLVGGAEPDHIDANHWTALMYAAAHSSYGAAGSIRRLVRAGADVDRRAGIGGKTALMIAAEKGNEQTVDALLRASARRDLKSSNRSALDFALIGGHTKCAEKLGYVKKENRPDRAGKE
jgi:uncharacterized protein